jgi:hypothetical protein
MHSRAFFLHRAKSMLKRRACLVCSRMDAILREDGQYGMVQDCEFPAGGHDPHSALCLLWLSSSGTPMKPVLEDMHVW